MNHIYNYSSINCHKSYLLLITKTSLIYIV